jgi:hypothetical protein
MVTGQLDGERAAASMRIETSLWSRFIAIP